MLIGCQVEGLHVSFQGPCGRILHGGLCVA